MKRLLNSIAHFLAPERKSLAGADAGLLALTHAAAPTAAGVHVGPASALTVPAVACAVRAISEAAACLDIVVMHRSDAASRPVPGHPAAVLLSGAVNSWTDGVTFIRDLVAQALLYDEGGMALVGRALDGRPVEITHYDPGCLTCERATDGTGEPTYRLHGQIVPAGDVIHLQSPFGRAPASLARESIGLAMTISAHAARLFANGGRPGGILTLKERASGETVARIREGWMKAHGGGRSGGTAILEGGAEYQPLAMTSTDSQFFELLNFQVLEIARAFRVPATMLQDLSRATWSNTEAMGREFLVFTLEPWLRALEGALTRALIPAHEHPHTRMAFDRDDLTRADMGVRASAYSSLIAAGVMSSNEIRVWENLPPREGGDTFGNPFTSTPDGAAAIQEETP